MATALDGIMKDLHKANDNKDKERYDFYRNLFIQRWNEGNDTKLSHEQAGGLFTDDEVNIGGFWFKKAR